jgi:hypothetical protein
MCHRIKSRSCSWMLQPFARDQPKRNATCSISEACRMAVSSARNKLLDEPPCAYHQVYTLPWKLRPPLGGLGGDREVLIDGNFGFKS